MSAALAEGGDEQRPIVIGVLSDTHGHLYPQVREALKGVDHIIHAGDVGSGHVLTALKAIAPVTAVRGNCDQEAWAEILPLEAELEMGGARILVGHISGRLRDRLRPVLGAPGPSAFRVVVSGHTHRVESEEREGILHLNPGSAGPERFGHPRTVARLCIAPLTAEQRHGPHGPFARVQVKIAIVPGD
ncbi:MAG: hypothetical protein A2W26_01420 [Acidobacteria bacterium RBG_16_64_8]|nr:MAG: hypothetical protein A2W26_01420 [Acidobacteria bacterium RBG_16_64_8]